MAECNQVGHECHVVHSDRSISISLELFKICPLHFVVDIVGSVSPNKRRGQRPDSKGARLQGGD